MKVWGYEVPSGARTVDSHIRSIRRKLGADVVRTVHGVGYAVEDGAGVKGPPERPLDPLPTLKLKLSVVILAAVAVTVVVFWAGVRLGMWPSLSGVIAGFIALVVVWFLSRGLTSPLREMVAATEAMARGDFSQRVTATSHDEIGTLARSFNQMAAELAETDRMRRDLVANVSHELRTPITALQAVLENIVDGVAEPDPETFATMLSQVERLGRLVQQLLDLSRLESGTLALDRRQFEIEPMLELALRESRLHAGDVSLEIEIEPRPFSLEADAERLHQVVANLVENAVRHSPRDGRVLVRAIAAADGARLEVIDEGPGHPRRRRGARVRALLPRRLRALVARRRRRARPRRSRAGSSSCTAATSAPSDANRTAAAWSCTSPAASSSTSRRRRWSCERRAPAPVPVCSERVPVHQRKRVTVSLTPIDDALRRIRRGEMVLVVDDEDRENEGDLTLAAEWVTPEAVNFMLRWARGLVCMPCDGTWLDKLDIEPMVPPGRAGCDTAFTVSIDHRNAGSGIGAADRALTIRRFLDPGSRPDDFIRPGHVFPLRAREGGVLERRGHTEAAVDLARLAGLPPVAVICEVLHDDGSPARFPYLELFAEEHRIAMISVAQVADHRARDRRHRIVDAPAAALTGSSSCAGPRPVPRSAHERTRRSPRSRRGWSFPKVRFGCPTAPCSSSS